MTRRRITPLLLALCLSLGCKKPAADAARPGAGPQVPATVITVRTVIEPEKQQQVHTIVVAGDVARNTRELDRWHLYDLKAERVTAVDEIAETIREYTVAELAAERRTVLAGNVPAHYPRPRLVATDEKRTLLGVPAQKYVIESGTYRRELWIGEHPAIPPGLFTLMNLAEPASTPLAPIMRGVDQALREVRGFPLLDRTEVTFGNKQLVIERAVVSVAQREVAKGMITPPEPYRNLTPRAEKKKK